MPSNSALAPCAVVLALFVIQGRAVAPLQLTWWIANPLLKIRPGDAAPGQPTRAAMLYAARNEFEPFQLVLRDDSADLAAVDVQVSDLRSLEGGEISRSNATVYLESYVNLDQPSSVEGDAGQWPDPLIPRVDRYAGERRDAFPFNVRRGRNQPVWIEVYVPADTRPGDYSGAVSVSIGGREQFKVPVHLKVWRFALPSTSSLRSSFGLSGIALLKAHRGAYTNDAELDSMTRLYAKAALQHRISTHGGTMRPPKFSFDRGRARIDWSAYDEEVGPFLDGTVIKKDEPLWGAKSTSVDLRTPAEFAGRAEQRLYWQAWVSHFERKGWLDRLFLYLWDEPAPATFPEVLKRGRAAVQADTRIRSLITVPFTRQLEDVVRIWVPLVNCLEPKDGEDYCGTTPRFDVYQREARQGKSLWFYQSCASHGCNIVGGRYFTGWPSYMIDASGAANRVMQWVAWKYGIEGELYYSVNESYSQSDDPWTKARLSGGNGDGTLFYPGQPRRIGGRSDIPIESIRLKLIREGMEDYEYLALLASISGRKTADDFAAKNVKQAYRWEARPEPFLSVRKDMGETLHRLSKSRPAGGSGAE